MPPPPKDRAFFGGHIIGSHIICVGRNLRSLHKKKAIIWRIRQIRVKLASSFGSISSFRQNWHVVRMFTVICLPSFLFISLYSGFNALPNSAHLLFHHDSSFYNLKSMLYLLVMRQEITLNTNISFYFHQCLWINLSTSTSMIIICWSVEYESLE